MDQLKFQQSSMKKRHQRDETSQKKYGFKYYDYCDMVPNRHRLADSMLAHSVCQPRVKPLNIQKSFAVQRKVMKSMSQYYNSNVSNKQKKPQQSNISDQLQYYKQLCKNLRKQNTLLKSHQQNYRPKLKPKPKRADNKSKLKLSINKSKQNIDFNKYEQLLKQLSTIQNKLNKQESLSKNTHKSFYLDFIKSLSQLGIKEPKNTKQALNQWRKIVEYIQKYSD